MSFREKEHSTRKVSQRGEGAGDVDEVGNIEEVKDRDKGGGDSYVCTRRGDHYKRQDQEHSDQPLSWAELTDVCQQPKSGLSSSVVAF